MVLCSSEVLLVHCSGELCVDIVLAHCKHLSGFFVSALKCEMLFKLCVCTRDTLLCSLGLPWSWVLCVLMAQRGWLVCSFVGPGMSAGQKKKANPQKNPF